MNPGASVTFVPALQEWHAALITFRSEAQDALSLVNMAIQQAADWLETQLRTWEREYRVAEEAVVHAKTELSNRRFPDYSGRVPDCSVQEEELHRAEQRRMFIEDQIDTTRRWMIKLPQMVTEVYDGPARRLGRFLETDLPVGLAQLKQQLAALEAYLSLRAPESKQGST